MQDNYYIPDFMDNTNKEEKLKTLGKEVRRLSSITDYLMESELQLEKVNKGLAEEMYKTRNKVKEMKERIENYREHMEHMIRWKRMTAEENEQYDKEHPDQ